MPSEICSMNAPPTHFAENSPRVWLALGAALVGSIGSVWLSLGLELRACPLCLYQRACMLCTAAVLLIGILLRKQEPAAIGTLALAPAVAARGIGAFHVFLEKSGALECPSGIAQIGSAPQQAVAAEALVLALVIMAAVPRWFAGVVAVLLGAGLASLMIRSSPPLPPKPDKPYTTKFDMCRPPFTP